MKSAGIKSDFVLEGQNGNPSWELIGDSIFDKYNFLNRPVSTAFVQKGIEFTDESMPKLAQVPNPEYIVPIEEGERNELEGDATEIVS